MSSSTLFEVKVEASTTSTTLLVDGELDLRSVSELTRKLEEQLAASRRFVALDLSGVGFIDSCAVSALVESHEKFRARRGALRVVRSSPAVDRLMRLLRVHFMRAPEGDARMSALAG